jgi:hypothetical protein
MTLVITINPILSTVVFAAIVSLLAAATRPSRDFVTLATTSRRVPSSRGASAAPEPLLA